MALWHYYVWYKKTPFPSISPTSFPGLIGRCPRIPTIPSGVVTFTHFSSFLLPFQRKDFSGIWQQLHICPSQQQLLPILSCCSSSDLFRLSLLERTRGREKHLAASNIMPIAAIQSSSSRPLAQKPRLTLYTFLFRTLADARSIIIGQLQCLPFCIHKVASGGIHSPAKLSSLLLGLAAAAHIYPC